MKGVSYTAYPYLPNQTRMQDFKEFLKGKKSYIISVVTFLYAIVVVGWQLGDWNQANELILASLGLSALRGGMR